MVDGSRRQDNTFWPRGGKVQVGYHFQLLKKLRPPFLDEKPSITTSNDSTSGENSSGPPANASTVFQAARIRTEESGETTSGPSATETWTLKRSEIAAAKSSDAAIRSFTSSSSG